MYNSMNLKLVRIKTQDLVMHCIYVLGYMIESFNSIRLPLKYIMTLLMTLHPGITLYFRVFKTNQGI